jgi:hypothetical protein
MIDIFGLDGAFGATSSFGAFRLSGDWGEPGWYVSGLQGEVSLMAPSAFGPETAFSVDASEQFFEFPMTAVSTAMVTAAVTAPDDVDFGFAALSSDSFVLPTRFMGARFETRLGMLD